MAHASESSSTERAERLYDQSLEEHRRLCRTIVDLERDVRRIGRDPGDREADARIRSGLDDLVGRLAGHFAEEEAPDGLYAQLERSLPHELPHLRALKDEHGELLRELSSLRQESGEPAPISEAMGARLHRALQGLARHESRENQALFDAVGGRDLGSPD